MLVSMPILLRLIQENATSGEALVQEQTALDMMRDGQKQIRVLRIIETSWTGLVTAKTLSWIHGELDAACELRSLAKIVNLYGGPDSKSPSSRNGQQLELWYYAFDWAGADVPQVMEVLCTKEKDGKPGRVIEITLAAPSL